MMNTDLVETNPTEDTALALDNARVADLKRQLAAEYAQHLDAVQARVDGLNQQIADLTEQRKRAVDDLRSTGRELARLTGQRSDRSPSAAAGEFGCKHPGCGRSFATKQGLTMHNTRTHKPDPPRRSPSPPPGSPSTRTVYRCGDLDCGREVKTLSDLSHHTLTAHRRQPTPAEKILVTPDI